MTPHLLLIIAGTVCGKFIASQISLHYTWKTRNELSVGLYANVLLFIIIA
jgi:hypothetical protein